MSSPYIYSQPQLPPETITPSNNDLFIPYFARVYQDIATAVNAKDFNHYPMAISSNPVNIVNAPNFGAFIICVSGENSSLPTITASLCKASSTATGSIAVLGSQAGTGSWSGNTLTITSTASNFQIRHNRTGVTGGFNIRLIGTQG